MSFLEQDKELLLVHTGMDKVFLSKSVNVMVTPQFYTVKKEVLPVNYAYQAKRIAASLFDGLLEEEGTYAYEVMKEDDAWIFMAYDIEKIMLFLESKGIPREKVSKLYFAQQALASFTQPLILNDKEALVVLNDTLVVVPKIALGTDAETSLRFSNAFTPKKGMTLQGSTSSVITQTQAFSFAAVFLLFAGIFFVESSRYSEGEETGAGELHRLYKKHAALKSSYVRDGIIKKYSKIDTRERLKRDKIKHFSKWISKDVKLNHLTVDDKTFKASVTCSKSKTLAQIKALAKKENYTVQINQSSRELKIEGAL